MRNFYAQKRGFTLVELMVVIAIISILASFTAPSFEKHIAKANLVEVQLLASTITSNVDEYILTQSTFPTANEFKQLLPTNSDTITHINSIAATKVDNKQGSVTLTMNDSIGIDSGQYLKYSRNTLGLWICSTTLPLQIAPENCTIAATEDGDTP